MKNCQFWVSNPSSWYPWRGIYCSQGHLFIKIGLSNDSIWNCTRHTPTWNLAENRPRVDIWSICTVERNCPPESMPFLLNFVRPIVTGKRSGEHKVSLEQRRWQRLKSRSIKDEMFAASTKEHWASPWSHGYLQLWGLEIWKREKQKGQHCQRPLSEIPKANAKIKGKIRNWRQKENEERIYQWKEEPFGTDHQSPWHRWAWK